MPFPSWMENRRISKILPLFSAVSIQFSRFLLLYCLVSLFLFYLVNILLFIIIVKKLSLFPPTHFLQRTISSYCQFPSCNLCMPCIYWIKSHPTGNFPFLYSVVKKYNQNFGDYEQVKRYQLVAEEWTPQNGFLSPTLKLKRNVIEANYAERIEKLFS